jgi:hypothetical protein
MSANPAQSFKSHTKFDPKFHFFLMPVFLITLIGYVVSFVKGPNLHSGWMVVVALAALVAVFTIRIYALKVQDRIIRLEERLRLCALPEAVLGKLDEKQLVALRFASDAEAPALAQKAAAESMKPKEIKAAIQNWRPDYFRV